MRTSSAVAAWLPRFRRFAASLIDGAVRAPTGSAGPPPRAPLLRAALAARPTPRSVPLQPRMLRLLSCLRHDHPVRRSVEKQGSSAFGQLALGRLLSAPDHATGCLKLRPASAAALAGHISCELAALACFRRRYAAVDWAQNLRSLPGSLILRRIKSPLLFNIGITTIICLLHSLYGPWPAGIALPHTLLSSALGLTARSKCTVGRDPARPLRLPGARLVALGAVHSQGERPAHRAPSHRLGCSS